MRISAIPRILARLARKDGRQAIVAAGVLACANLALKLLPFSRAIVLGSRPIRGETQRGEGVVDEWAAAVARAARMAPWRSVCIHQGLALQWLLRKQGVQAVLHYGTSLEGGELAAHVWVKVGDRIVIGGEEAPKFHELATYPAAESPS